MVSNYLKLPFNGNLQFYRIPVRPTRRYDTAPAPGRAGVAPVSHQIPAANPVIPSKMPIRSRHLAIALAAALIAGGLGGCGTINTYLADSAGDYIPHWLGGMPAD